MEQLVCEEAEPEDGDVGAHFDVAPELELIVAEEGEPEELDDGAGFAVMDDAYGEVCAVGSEVAGEQELVDAMIDAMGDSMLAEDAYGVVTGVENTCIPDAEVDGGAPAGTSNEDVVDAYAETFFEPVGFGAFEPVLD